MQIVASKSLIRQAMLLLNSNKNIPGKTDKKISQKQALLSQRWMFHLWVTESSVYTIYLTESELHEQKEELDGAIKAATQAQTIATKCGFASLLHSANVKLHSITCKHTWTLQTKWYMYRSIEPLAPLDKWLDHGSIYLLYHGFHHIHTYLHYTQCSILDFEFRWKLYKAYRWGSGGMPLKKKSTPVQPSWLYWLKCIVTVPYLWKQYHCLYCKTELFHVCIVFSIKCLHAHGKEPC